MGADETELAEFGEDGIDLGFFGWVDAVEEDAEFLPEIVDGERDDGGGSVDLGVVPDAPEGEDDEGGVAGEACEELAGIGGGADLEEGGVVIDDEVETEG